jgi:hypothetical protein
MPHIRAARLEALEDEVELGELLRLQNSTLEIGWNIYPDSDLPESTYHPYPLVWVSRKGVATMVPGVIFVSTSP